MIDGFPTRSRLPYSILASLLFAPAVAQAHVKWFCGPIDFSSPPAPLREVVTPFFLSLLVVFAAIVAVGATLDALVGRFVPGPIVDSARSAVICDTIVRLGVAGYALCLWGNLTLVLWADRSSSAILTPELYGTNRLVGYLQLAIAVAVLVPRLSLLAAAGLTALYMMGVARFGPFYMIDYLFFLGLAAYVALTDPVLGRYARFRHYRFPVLIASLSVSLTWTAVEKFLFPQWTIFVLVLHPSITAGYSFARVATIAGFVEFSLAFYLLAGREILGRIGAVLLTIVFVAAMPEFGMLDVVGHIPVIVILLVALITGETPMQIWFRGDHANVLRSGLRVSGFYVIMLMLLMSLYYGLHAFFVAV